MKNGPYTLVKAPEGYPGKRYRGLYCYEHHAVLFANNISIPPAYHVHHINGNHRDNRLENLAVISEKEHHDIHKKPITYVMLECPKCGGVFRREKRNTYHKMNFCSAKCSGAYNFPGNFKKKEKDLRGV